MDWTLDRDRPISQQLVEKISTAIVKGEYAPGEKMPSVRDFAVFVAVNPNTVQKTFNELERRQVLYAVASQGWYVSENAPVAASREVEELRRVKIGEYLHAMQELGCDAEQALSYLQKTIEENKGD